MEVDGFIIQQISATSAYIKVPDDYRAYSPSYQVIRIKPGYFLEGLDYNDYSPILRKSSSNPDHQCFRTYIPMRMGCKHIEVDNNYTGNDVIYALETDTVIYNGKTMHICDRKGRTWEDRNGVFPIMVEWVVMRVTKPRRKDCVKPGPSLLMQVLYKEASKRLM
jgi:hypothetical protein